MSTADELQAQGPDEFPRGYYEHLAANPAPYYSDDLVTLYHGDCIELADVWTKTDVLVTDPPYGMKYVSGWDTKGAIANDDDPTVRDAVLALWDGPAAVFGTWRVPRPGATKQVLIWNKQGVGPGMGDLATAFGTSHEEVYLIGHWPKGIRPRRGSVITTVGSPSSLTVKTGHPTPKPVALMEALIECAPPGVIADPFAGSGATLLAARNLHRQVIGVEIEERYCEAMAKRFASSSATFDFDETESW